jgi:hypothetical protein
LFVISVTSWLLTPLVCCNTSLPVLTAHECQVPLSLQFLSNL